MIQETTNKQIERIQPEFRDPFELILMKIMIEKTLGKNLSEASEDERHKAQNEWVINYAKKVGDIIDNMENKEIRDLIMEGQYKEASGLVLEALESKEPVLINK